MCVYGFHMCPKSKSKEFGEKNDTLISYVA